MSQLIDPQLSGQFDRLLPHSIEAEQCLVACTMLSDEALDEVSELINREDFYQTDHQIIFDARMKMRAADKPRDVKILVEELIQRQYRRNWRP